MADDAEKTGNRYQLSDTDVRLMTGGVDFAVVPGKDGFVPRHFKPNLIRVGAFCAVPMIPGVLLILSAVNYYNTIPTGDMPLRYLSVGICLSMASVSLIGALYLYGLCARRVIKVEPLYIVLSEGRSSVRAKWREVAVRPTRSRVIKTLILIVAGRRVLIDSLFFPDFKEIVTDVNERVQRARAAATDTTYVV